MPSLLFEGSEDLKISELDKENQTVKVSMENHSKEAEYSFLEINLSLHELEILVKWLDDQIYAIKEINKNNVA